MLKSLRHHFVNDSDVNQRAREGSMQRAVHQLVSEAFPGFESRTNITIRSGGKTQTDINFVLIDTQYGDVLLCQFKFQDPYGADFKTRSSRMSRFMNDCLAWLTAVKEWVAKGEMTLRSALRLRRNSRITRVRKLIVAKHHAHALYDAAATLGRWSKQLTFFRIPQQARIVSEMVCSFGPICTHCSIWGYWESIHAHW
jgi:hypothetical protein